MYLHANAKLGLAGRFALVKAVEEGMTLKAAAAAFSVSPATAHRWWHRWLEASEDARRTLTCLFDRSSRPRCSPRRLAPELEKAICACRRETGWGPRLVAGATGFAHSTVWKVLKRAGISRPPRTVKEPAHRYEWPCPGDLLHMDTSRYARFVRPGHRVTGDRSQRSRNWMRAETRVGYDYAHAIVDDHSRLAFVDRDLPCARDRRRPRTRDAPTHRPRTGLLRITHRASDRGRPGRTDLGGVVAHD
jgi:transposase